MKLFTAAVVLCLLLIPTATQPPDAPTGFDNKSNGMVDDATHQADLAKFDEFEQLPDGLGPLYNAQSCRECHQNPVSGAASQVSELRVGHQGPDGHFRTPDIPIAHGAEIISGRSLVNDRAICPSGAFSDKEIQERVPNTETIRTFRISLNLLGDGFIEAVADKTFVDLSKHQCESSHGKICGQVLYVPIVEAPGQMGVGRFGWKDQQASLLSFSGDAYLNEMGITNRLQPAEVTNLCNTASEPNDTPGPDGLSDVDHFARFMRATKAPARDAQLAASDAAKKGKALFDKIGCAACHVASLTTAPAGTKINGGTFTIPAALGSVVSHPYGDFLMHDVGTGDGILQATPEHYGRKLFLQMSDYLAKQNFESSRNKIRTAPLWGVRLRPRLMHDGASVTFLNAISRHRGEASQVKEQFEKLSQADKNAILEFLRSL
ncbi:MAG TPA: di-heme oxidoredictase family protein [Candidatus Dormibacteraeota bacterium]|nr:di-heme oxidoredictase family protein [Candidatus Dormibacteraeota bacterium]